MPLAHPISYKNVLVFLKNELLRRLSIGFILSLWAVVALYRKDREKQKALFCLFFLFAMTAAGLAARFKAGGFVNNIVPIGAALAFCCAFAEGLALDSKKWFASIHLLMQIAFFAQLFYLPQNAISPPQVQMEMRMKVELFRGLEEPVFAPCDPYVSKMAGKNSSAFWGAICDVLLAPGQTSDLLREELSNAFKQRKFRTVVLRKKFFMQDHFPYRQLEANYKAVDSGDWMQAGQAEMLPMDIYVPKKLSPQSRRQTLYFVPAENVQ